MHFLSNHTRHTKHRSSLGLVAMDPDLCNVEGEDADPRIAQAMCALEAKWRGARDSLWAAPWQRFYAAQVRCLAWSCLLRVVLCAGRGGGMCRSSCLSTPGQGVAWLQGRASALLHCS